MRMVVVLNTNRTNITNLFGYTDRHRWTRIYHADGVFFEHEYHEYHEYFWAHGYSRMDTDFTVRTIGYHKDSQEADKPVLPAVGGGRGGR